MKPCICCGKTKSLSEFHAHPKMRDGHLNKCKICVSEYVRARNERLSQNPSWVLSELKRHREKSRKYRASGRAKRQTNEAKQAYIERNPHKRAAHNAVNRAIKCGELIPMPCERCEEEKTEAHHEDYAKPLDVNWLCVRCHNDRHIEIKEAQILSK